MWKAALGGAAILFLQAAAALSSEPYQVVDLVPGVGDAGIDAIVAAGPDAVFSRGVELWASDGSAAGTLALHAGPVRNLTAHDGRVAFTVPRSGPGREELWFTDPTSTGATLASTIVGEGTCDVFGSPCTGTEPQLAALTSVGDLLYFRQNGYALWRSDGTTDGTQRIAFYASRVCSTGCFCCFHLGAELGQFTAVNERLSLVMNNGFTGEYAIERADGASVSPVTSSIFADVLAGVRGRLFIAEQAPFVPTALWVNDGDGTRPLVAFADDSRQLSRLTASAGLLYFVVGAGSPTAELWRSDGTPAGTFALLAGDADQLTAFADGLAFRRLQPGGGELWHSDGTVAGTAMVSPLTPSEITALDATLFFVAGDADGAELWRSDGTAGGTAQVADLVPGPAGSSPAALTAACGRLFFTATTPAAGRELWALDVAPGTCALADEASCVVHAECDRGVPCTSGQCGAAGCSTFALACCSDAACADGDACTIDQCNPLLGCSHTLPSGLEAVTCVFGAAGSEADRCPGEILPRYVGQPLERVRTLLARASAQMVPSRALKRVAGVIRALDRTQRRVDRALGRGAISGACRAALSEMIATGRSRAAAWMP